MQDDRPEGCRADAAQGEVAKFQRELPGAGRGAVAHGVSQHLAAHETGIRRVGEGAVGDHIQRAVEEGVPVSVADIAYSNGSDNTLVYGLYKRQMLYKLDAYNGWNTASNTIGYAIAQSILGKDMDAQKHKDMLTQQYLDNWAYQANIRKDIYRMQDSIRVDNVRYTGTLNDKLQEYMNERVQDFAEKYLGIDPRTVSATFPWGRLFETDITVYDTPSVPLQRDIRLQREAEARAKAEAEAKAKAAAEAAAKAQAAAAAAQANGNAQQGAAAPATTAPAAQ